MLTFYRLFLFFRFGGWAARDLVLPFGLCVGQQHPCISPTSMSDQFERLTR